MGYRHEEPGREDVPEERGFFSALGVFQFSILFFFFLARREIFFSPAIQGTVIFQVLSGESTHFILCQTWYGNVFLRCQHSCPPHPGIVSLGRVEGMAPVLVGRR